MKKICIILLMLCLCFTGCASKTNPPSETDTETRAEEACVAKYTGAKTIIAHAGQRIMAGNAEIEILFTHEMLSPLVVANPC